MLYSFPVFSLRGGIPRSARFSGRFFEEKAAPDRRGLPERC